MAKKLIEGLKEVFRAQHYAYRTEETYLKWIKRFVAHNGNRHPRELGAEEIQAFLTHLAVDGKVPVVLTRDEVKGVLSCLSGTHWLMANILYGSGLRLLECLCLRIQDVDCETYCSAMSLLARMTFPCRMQSRENTRVRRSLGNGSTCSPLQGTPLFNTTKVCAGTTLTGPVYHVP